MVLKDNKGKHVRVFRKLHIRGFTLIEMSIVLVITGLVIGMILNFQNVLDNSKMRKLIVEVNEVKQAVATFKMKYKAFPGDFAEATVRWPSGGAANGNGDGSVYGETEGLAAWQHLALAGMYPGSYNGTYPGGLNPPIIGQNVPGTAIDGTWFNLWQHTGVNAIYGRGDISLNFNGGSSLWGGALTGVQAYKFDKKYDDAIASKGTIYGAKDFDHSWQNNVCTSGVNVYNSDVSGTEILYNQEYDQRHCWMFFWFN